MPIGFRRPVIRVREMTAVPKVLLADIEQEKRALTVLNVAKIKASKAGFASELPDAYVLFKEDDEYLYTPRNHQPALKRGLQQNIDYTIRHEVINTATWTLGEDRVGLGPNEHQPYDQVPAFAALVAPKRWPFGRILALRCGAGKTAIALKAAHHRRARTLWVTINTTLLEQMRGSAEREGDITKWLGIPIEEIGHVQANKEKWQGYGIAVAMLHSLARRQYPQEFWDYWDLVIFDEGDVLAANEFSTVAPRFRGERWLLTATPKRDDGMEPLFEKHIGPRCYTDLEYDLKPECYFVNTKATDKVLAFAGWDHFRHERRVCYPVVARKLLFDDERNRLLFKMVEEASGFGRTCLVLGASVEGLAYACKQAQAVLPHLTHGLVVGRVSQKERTAIIQNNNVVWATQQLAYRGLDRPAFDTLIIATVSTAKPAIWRQAVGRVLRAQKDKRSPVVAVLSDINVGPLAGLAAKLAGIFKAERWTIHNGQELINMQRARSQALREEAQQGYQTRGE